MGLDLHDGQPEGPGNPDRHAAQAQTDHSPLHRHTTVYAVDLADDGKSADAVSSFVVYQNMLDGINSHIDSGESRLFLVGKYIARFKIEEGAVKFLSREVRLDNRRLDKGSH